MTTKHWLVVFIQSVLVAWALLFLVTYFDLSFVAEAWGA